MQQDFDKCYAKNSTYQSLYDLFHRIMSKTSIYGVPSSHQNKNNINLMTLSKILETRTIYF